MYLDPDQKSEEEGMLANGKTAEEQKAAAWADRKPSKITICYFMGASYAATLGGCGTIVGSGTNLAFKGIYDSLFPEDEIEFPAWMIFNIPPMLINTFVTWAYLQWVYMGMFRPNSKEAKESQLGAQGEEVARNVIAKKYKELGPISSHEISVACLFVLSVILFFTRAPGFITGWAEMITKTKIGDATPAIFIVVVLFMLPANWDFLNFCKARPDSLPKTATPSLITWKYINAKLPWSLIFLLGGGFALARGGKETGMSAMLGDSLSSIKDFPFLLVLFLICLFAQIFTEFASNVAVANVMLPVLAEMSKTMGVHPLYLMYPAALSCSMAFHTPVGTPPNAIAAGVANINTKDMVSDDVVGHLPICFCLISDFICSFSLARDIGYCRHWSVTHHTVYDLGILPDMGIDSLSKNGNVPGLGLWKCYSYFGRGCTSSSDERQSHSTLERYECCIQRHSALIVTQSSFTKSKQRNRNQN